MTLADRRGVDVEVYEPAEDSRLLVTASDEHVDPEDLVLDVGTGSGYVAKNLREATGARVIGSDVNPIACRRAHAAGIETVCGDLVSPFRSGTFDVVVFNPPYLPADPDAAWDDWFEVAVTGGGTGRAVIERFLDDVGRVLKRDGFALMVVSTVTDIEAVVADAADQGFSAAAVADAPFPGETLTVLKFVR